MKKNTMLKPYQEKAINSFNKICDFSGKRILEICGGSSPVVALELLKRGAEKVISIDYHADLVNKQYSENLEFFNMDARTLEFEKNQFDIVFGVAVLEHLNNLDKVLSEIRRVLVKNGCAYLHGAPIWSCRQGHHVWVHVDDVAYRFNGNNPIPDWGHLIYQKEEMREYLESRNIKPEHVEKIVHFIYDSPNLNRYHYEDIIKYLKKSKLTVLKIEHTLWGAADKKILAALKATDDRNNKGIFHSFMRKSNCSLKNHSIGAIEAILRK